VVTGVDVNEEALAQARTCSGGNVNYVLGNMRRLQSPPLNFDSARIMWASFGNFDAATREQKVGGRVVAIEKEWLTGDRLTVRLEYVQGGLDVFEWQVYRPEEMQGLAERVGFSLLRKCSSF